MIADTARVAQAIADALTRGRGLSVISLCDGEAQVLWAAKGLQTFHYLASHGFPSADRPQVALELVAAISTADIVCLPRSGPAATEPSFGPKLRAAMELWDARPKADALIGDSLVCFYLMFDAWLWGCLEDRRVLVVNDRADLVAQALTSKRLPYELQHYVPAAWVNVRSVRPVMLEIGLAGNEKALTEVAEAFSDATTAPEIVLVGAGARAAHLCVTIAQKHQVPVVELGDVLRLMHEDYGRGRWDQVYEWYRKEG